MTVTSLVPPVPSQAAPASESLADLERRIAGSKVLARCIIVGLPTLGLLSSLLVGLPLFAALMSASLMLGTGLVCHRAIGTFAGRTLRLLVASRLVISLVLGAALFCASGLPWMGLVSATLLWLVADRLLGRRALHDLWRLVRESR